MMMIRILLCLRYLFCFIVTVITMPRQKKFGFSKFNNRKRKLAKKPSTSTLVDSTSQETAVSVVNEENVVNGIISVGSEVSERHSTSNGSQPIIRDLSFEHITRPLICANSLDHSKAKVKSN